jgi:hypothetical protein
MARRLTVQQVLELLDTTEPSPRVFQSFDSEQYAILLALFKANDTIRAKALFVLSQSLPPAHLEALLFEAAQLDPGARRTAAAAALRLPVSARTKLLSDLLQDKDISVVRIACRAVKSLPAAQWVPLRAATEKAQSSETLGEYWKQLLAEVPPAPETVMDATVSPAPTRVPRPSRGQPGKTRGRAEVKEAKKRKRVGGGNRSRKRKSVRSG